MINEATQLLQYDKLNFKQAVLFAKYLSSTYERELSLTETQSKEYLDLKRVLVEARSGFERRKTDKNAIAYINAYNGLALFKANYGFEYVSVTDFIMRNPVTRENQSLGQMAADVCVLFSNLSLLSSKQKDQFIGSKLDFDSCAETNKSLKKLVK